jgi:hypothetical protein
VRVISATLAPPEFPEPPGRPIESRQRWGTRLLCVVGASTGHASERNSFFGTRHRRPGFGYDYPWPHGREVISFLGWRIGPWFDNTFNHKNYPNNNAADLKVRHDIVVKFMDSLNTMLKGLAAPPDVLHVDLTGTLQTKNDWANELHPTNAGFKVLADKIDAALQANV